MLEVVNKRCCSNLWWTLAQGFEVVIWDDIGVVVFWEIFGTSRCCQDRMLQVNIALTSGRSTSFSIPQSSKVGDLKAVAQESLEKPFLRLVTAAGRILSDPAEHLEAAGLQDGDQLTAIAGQPNLAASARAFALWCPGGHRVVTWGHPDYGGDSSAFHAQLWGVQQVQATVHAFAAILEDGSVVAWGDPKEGGDCSAVQHQLRSVRQVRAT